MTAGAAARRATAKGSGAPDGLNVRLDYALPESVVVGDGSAVFVCGSCFARDARIERLELIVDGEAQPLMASGMPRQDVFKAFHPSIDPFATQGMEINPDSREDPRLHSFRSGFWGMVELHPRTPRGPRELRLRATLASGERPEATLGAVEESQLDKGPPLMREPDPASGPFVAICMATYEPEPGLLAMQIESIREQTHRNWVCLISDDCSSPKRFAELERIVGDDRRFLVSRSPRRRHFYHNFERALALAPANARFVAMADQDDRWHPDKLASLLGALGDAQLVYSDARIVDPDGEVVSETYWSERRNNHTSIPTLMVANSVTGAASLFRRELLDRALPFPPRQFSHFHDHWIALVAAALGRIEFVNRPLYDYVQHGTAVLGHAGANFRPKRPTPLGWLKKDPAERVRSWRLHYFVDCCRLIQFTTVLNLRCGADMTSARRREINRFARAEHSQRALVGLARRAGQELVGTPQTMGAEIALSFAFAWRRLVVAATGGLERPRKRLRIDARPPTTLLPVPGRRDPNSVEVGRVAGKIEPLDLALREGGPERVNILIPTIDLAHFFGGYIAKLNLARRLADRGARVRIVTVDPVGVLPPSWPKTLESYSGLDGLFDEVEVEFGRESQGLEVSPRDRFIATTWWTAHIAHEALRTVESERFLYLIQEYEPFTFPMGTFAALAEESYRFPHTALYSTELLRGYFREHGLGVYAAGRAEGDAASASFQNAITAVMPPSPDELAARRTRRLLFYARPEPHAARNMFELGVLALSRAVRNGVFDPDWELNGIGTIDTAQQLQLGSRATLELVPRQDQSSYGDLLRTHDVGLSLMYTPHPSLVPIEMASAGLLTVTNSFENKTPNALAEISANLITAEPTVDGLAEGLAEAVARVDDHDGRARGSAVTWSRDWADSFPDELVETVESLLAAPAPRA